MLLTQRIEEMDLPSAEKTAANYLLAQGRKLKGQSTRRIASEAYTTPATLVRLGQRLGYEGWTDLELAWNYAEIDEKEVAKEYLENVEKYLDINSDAVKEDYNIVKFLINAMPIMFS